MSEISKRLIPWYQENRRDLPFRRNRDPYRIWVSEIMAQQTRIEAMLPKYEQFLKAFPDLKTLADADEEVLQKVWQGLGYYSRARNMKKCAIRLMEEYDGKFPRTKKELSSLPGIGPYTAGALASICFQENVSAVDGNVIRVFSRLYCILEPVAGPVKKKIETLVDESLPGSDGISEYNQGLMELGALVCVPGRPGCLLCPLKDLCLACEKGNAADLPLRTPKKARRKEYPVWNIWIWAAQDHFLVRMVRREENQLLAGLYGFDEERPAPDQIVNTEPFMESRHIFSHVEWQASANLIYVREPGKDFYSLDEIERSLAVPTAFLPFVRGLEKKEEEYYGRSSH